MFHGMILVIFFVKSNNNMAGRITFNSINIDFERPFDTFKQPNAVSGVTTQSQSGIEKVSKFFDQDFITATKERLTPQEIIEVERLYEYANGGATFSIERNRNLAAYISFEGHDHTTTADSLKTNDGVAGTFTRTGVADSAYFLNNHTGLMEAVAVTNNLPRYPAGKYGDGILIEGARTNLITNRVSNAAWTKTNMTAATTTETLSPDGLSNADKLTATADGGFAEFITSTVISTNDGAFSPWLKSPSGDVSTTLAISDDLGNILALDTVTVTPTWTRYPLVYENSVSDADDWRVVISITSNTDVIYSWHTPTLEVGANVLYPTQDIGAASTSSVTRNAEVLTYPTTNLNKDKFTYNFWVKPSWAYNSHPLVGLFHVDDLGGFRHTSYIITAGGNHELRLYNSLGAVAASVGGAASAFTQDTWAMVTITGDSTIATGLNLYIDSVLIGTSVNAAGFAAPDLGPLFWVGSLGGGSVADCVFDDIAIWKTVLTANHIKRIYNLGHSLGFRKNRFASVRLANPNFNPIHKVGDRYSLKLEMKEAIS